MNGSQLVLVSGHSEEGEGELLLEIAGRLVLNAGRVALAEASQETRLVMVASRQILLVFRHIGEFGGQFLYHVAIALAQNAGLPKRYLSGRYHKQRAYCGEPGGPD